MYTIAQFTHAEVAIMILERGKDLGIYGGRSNFTNHTFNGAFKLPIW